MILLAAFACCMVTHADELYFVTGYALKNVQVAETTATHYIVNTNLRTRQFTKSNVVRIILCPFDLSQPSVSEAYNDSLAALNDKTNTLPKPSAFADLTKTANDSAYYRSLQQFRTTPKSYPNLMWLNVSALAGIFAWANISTAASDNISSDYKTRSIIFGVISSTVTIVTIAHALTPVELKTDGKSLTLSVPIR